MNEETRVSLLALVVALVALGLTLSQLLQQFLGTAEGFRHCQSSVIGPWARLTKRSWRWSQFRFETRYTTPHITIPYPDEGMRATFDRVSLVGNDTPWEVEATIRPYRARQALLRGQKNPSLWLQWRFGQYLPPDSGTDTVSWLRFLQSMYEHEKQFAPRKDSGDRKEAERGESRVVVRLKEHSWDLVPPDVVRPMATSIVGTIMLIAKRLNMQWMELDPSRGVMAAEGSGHSIISSSVVRGLGLVLQYSYRPELKEALLRTVSRPATSFIPGHHSDRLLCGILPLSPGLNNTTELWLIYRNGRVNIETFFNTVRLPQDCIVTLEQTRTKRAAQFDMHIGEAFAVTCSFVPVAHVDTDWIMWPLPVSGDFECVLRCWGGSKVLLRRMLRRAPSDPLGATSLEKGNVLRALGQPPVDFVMSVFDTLEGQAEGQHARDAGFLKTLSSYYRLVLSVFEDVVNTRLNFADLISAHLILSTRALAEGFSSAFYDPAYQGKLSGDQNKGIKFFADLAGKYVDDLDGERTVVKHMRSRGCTLEDAEIEVLWCMLLLKGIIWFASVQIEFPQSTTPSYYFYSEVPVYIT